MKHRDKNVEEFVLKHLGLHKAPPREEMDLAEVRIEKKLRTASSVADDFEMVPRRRSTFNRFAVGFAAAAAVVLVVFLFIPRGMDAEAAVLDGSFSRTRGTKTEIVRVGESVEAGTIIRTNEGSGAIQLVDARVETKEQSEFLWERAEDGVRIRLNKGSVIVNAQSGTGRIYVQTANVVVFGTNSIFLVVAEEDGSHVGVIQGEVRVQQGADERKLEAAEQLATNPSMEALRVAEAIAWSRNAATHLDMLLRATRNTIKEVPKTFAVVSIRASATFVPGGRLPPNNCGGQGTQLELSPRRFAIRNATFYRLFTLAYGLKDCGFALKAGTITNGPDWLQSVPYDVEAVIPESAPVYTKEQLNRGEAPSLQVMIQYLLADRFKLMFHRELKDTVAFNLVVSNPDKLKLSEDQTPPDGIFRPVRTVPRGQMLNCTGIALAIPAFAGCLQRNVGGTVVDKTNLTGLYDIPPIPGWDFTIPRSPGAYADQLVEQIGLKIESVKTSAEIFVIDHVMKPTEN
jgi:uncharacterized protein (TIGR03435 family)